MKKFITLIISIIICFNPVYNLVYADENSLLQSEISIHEFSNKVKILANKYMPDDSLADGNTNISSFPLNRLIVKTATNEQLEETYGAVEIIEGFDCLHILQYSSENETEKAYESFLADDIVYVEHDTWVEIIDDSLTGKVQTCYCSTDSPLVGCDCPSNTEEMFMCVCPDKTLSNHLSWVSQAVQTDEAFALIESLGIECEPVKVAVFDTGLFIEHDYFLPERIALDPNYSLIIEEEINGTTVNVEYPVDVDEHYHGTHVSGIILR